MQFVGIYVEKANVFSFSLCCILQKSRIRPPGSWFWLQEYSDSDSGASMEANPASSQDEEPCNQNADFSSLAAGNHSEKIGKRGSYNGSADCRNQRSKDRSILVNSSVASPNAARHLAPYPPA